MMDIRQSKDRGRADFGWLDSRHSFSFGHYYDPRFMGIGPLRVINEDRVAPGAGFDTHGHQNMEILSYVLDGALEHKDSIGTGSVIRPGEVQRMTAGRGIRHSEFNHSKTDPVHFLQIWILPERQDLEPGYEQKAFSARERQGRLRLVGARDGRDGAVTIHQNVDLYVANLADDNTVRHALAPGRLAWVQIARGGVFVNGEALRAGDGAALRDVNAIELTGGRDAEVLLFDMAA
ncbi:MAG: pirin family protein [Alphaproteobacteria bacterium]